MMFTHLYICKLLDYEFSDEQNWLFIDISFVRLRLRVYDSKFVIDLMIRAGLKVKLPMASKQYNGLITRNECALAIKILD